MYVCPQPFYDLGRHLTIRSQPFLPVKIYDWSGSRPSVDALSAFRHRVYAGNAFFADWRSLVDFRRCTHRHSDCKTKRGCLSKQLRRLCHGRGALSLRLSTIRSLSTTDARPTCLNTDDRIFSQLVRGMCESKCITSLPILRNFFG